MPGLPRHSTIAGVLNVLSTFTLSGLLHTAAGVSSGMPAEQLGVFRFFCTQAAGLIVEQKVVSFFHEANRISDRDSSRPAWYARIAGFAWVAAFMIWTGPSWIYPQAARTPAKGVMAFLPFSVVGWLRGS